MTLLVVHAAGYLRPPPWVIEEIVVLVVRQLVLEEVDISIVCVSIVDTRIIARSG